MSSKRIGMSFILLLATIICFMILSPSISYAQDVTENIEMVDGDSNGSYADSINNLNQEDLSVDSPEVFESHLESKTVLEDTGNTKITSQEDAEVSLEMDGISNLDAENTLNTGSQSETNVSSFEENSTEKTYVPYVNNSSTKYVSISLSFQTTPPETVQYKVNGFYGILARQYISYYKGWYHAQYFGVVVKVS